MYKIFTHRPVADICAFGPRDYAGVALAAASATSAGVQHTQQAVFSPSPASEPRARHLHGWYQRHENNSWRHVDSSCTAQTGNDWLTRKRSQPVFHYSTKVRAAQRLHQQKMRRREWLVALYRFVISDNHDLSTCQVHVGSSGILDPNTGEAFGWFAVSAFQKSRKAVLMMETRTWI